MSKSKKTGAYSQNDPSKSRKTSINVKHEHAQMIKYIQWRTREMNYDSINNFTRVFELSVELTYSLLKEHEEKAKKLMNKELNEYGRTTEEEEKEFRESNESSISVEDSKTTN